MPNVPKATIRKFTLSWKQNLGQRITELHNPHNPQKNICLDSGSRPEIEGVQTVVRKVQIQVLKNTNPVKYVAIFMVNVTPAIILCKL